MILLLCCTIPKSYNKIDKLTYAQIGEDILRLACFFQIDRIINQGCCGMCNKSIDEILAIENEDLVARTLAYKLLQDSILSISTLADVYKVVDLLSENTFTKHININIDGYQVNEFNFVNGIMLEYGRFGDKNSDRWIVQSTDSNITYPDDRLTLDMTNVDFPQDFDIQADFIKVSSEYKILNYVKYYRYMDEFTGFVALYKLYPEIYVLPDTKVSRVNNAIGVLIYSPIETDAYVKFCDDSFSVTLRDPDTTKIFVVDTYGNKECIESCRFNTIKIGI